MFKNYLKVALRNLLNNKVNALVNIFGLSLAFVCSILLFVNAYNELSYDNFHVNRERIFKAYYRSIGPDGEELSRSMGYPTAPVLKQEVAEIEATTRYKSSGGVVDYTGKKTDLVIHSVDADFFKIFTFTVVRGNSGSILAGIDKAVITEYAAKKIFNTEDPIGKRIKARVTGKWLDLEVESVLKDFPDNSSIQFDVLIRSELNADFGLNKDKWNHQHHEVYVKLKPGAEKKQVETKLDFVLQKYSDADSSFMKNRGYKADENGNYVSMHLFPFKDNHFDPDLGGGFTNVSKTYLYVILLVGFFVLAIACFNFINLNIGQAFSRVKEMGVRKSLGAERKDIFLQIWGESWIICLVALALGLLASFILLPNFNQVFATKLTSSILFKASSISIIFLSLIFVSLFAGGYPALVISKFNTIKVLKGDVTIKRGGAFRNSLILFQFFMATLLMACTVIGYKQFEYLKQMPLGFNRESLISVPLQNSREGRKLVSKFRMALANQPSVLSISGSNINIGIGKDGNSSKQSNGFGYKDKAVFTNWASVDFDFLKTLDIKLVNGRDASKDFPTDTVNSVLITESMAKQFGEENPVGIDFSMDSLGPKWKIIGVIPDFHLYSLHEKLEPLALDFSSNSNINYLLVKVKSNNPLSSMALLEKTYKQICPGKEFTGSFVDENTNNWYNKEKRFSLLLASASVVTILISCLGLFALALLIIKQRVKEIGVRKVLGASIFNINKLLALDFIKLVVIAIIVAMPLAWWLMNQWLSDFPYRTEIGWSVFALVAICAIAISLLTICFHTIKAAMANPVKSLRTE